MGKLRASFGRYVLGNEPEDGKRISFLMELEKSSGSNSAAFRSLIDLAMASLKPTEEPDGNP